MPNILQLNRVNPDNRLSSNQIVSIDEVTHLGRSPNSKNLRARITPENIKDASTAILISHRAVSRNHCLIYPFDSNSFASIVDLNSKNGTYLNNMKLKAGQIANLEDDDLISLSQRVHFRCKINNVNNESIDLFHAKNCKKNDSNNYAVMIAYPLNSLDELEYLTRLKVELNERAFKRGITEYYNSSIQLDELLETINMYRAKAVNNSFMFFYFSGKILDSKYLELGNNSRIGIDKIIDELSDYRGHTIMAFDSNSFSNVYADDLTANSTLIQKRDNSSNYLIAKSITEIFNQNPMSMSLKDLVNELSKDKSIITISNYNVNKEVTNIILPSEYGY